MGNRLKSILLIDDDAATNYLNEKLLRKTCDLDSVQTVLSGYSALDYLTTVDESGHFPRPDLVFLDINMPGMTGWEFLEEYNKLPYNQRGGLVIMMLTTSLNPDDYDRAENNAHVKGFLCKPLTIAAVNSIVEEHFTSKEVL